MDVHDPVRACSPGVSVRARGGFMRAFRMVRVGLVGSILAGALAGLATFGSGASADTLSLLPTTTTTSTPTTTPLFVNWADLLPTLTDAYDPTSTNDCVAGRPN